MERDPHSVIGDKGRELARMAAQARARRPVPLPLPQPSLLPRWLRIWLGVAMLVIVCGTGFYMALGDRFVVAPAYAYGPWKGPVFLVLAPAFWLLFASSRTMEARLRVRTPTRWVQQLIMLPLLGALAAGSVVIAPHGWTAAAGWMVGEDRSGVPARLVAIDEYRPRAKGCAQYAELMVLETKLRPCLDGRQSGAPLKPGGRVRVGGKASRFGFLLDYIHPDEPPPPDPPNAG